MSACEDDEQSSSASGAGYYEGKQELPLSTRELRRRQEPFLAPADHADELSSSGEPPRVVEQMVPFRRPVGSGLVRVNSNAAVGQPPPTPLSPVQSYAGGAVHNDGHSYNDSDMMQAVESLHHTSRLDRLEQRAQQTEQQMRNMQLRIDRMEQRVTEVQSDVLQVKNDVLQVKSEVHQILQLLRQQSQHQPHSQSQH
jgi:hypothetical protein